MLFGYSRLYPADAIELAMPDAVAARALLAQHRPDILAGLTEVAGTYGGDARALNAALLGTARLGLRHGSFGNELQLLI